MKNILSPSVLSSDFAHMADNIRLLEEASVPWLHLDSMDGMFVPNISFGPPVITSFREVTDMFFDVHTMISEPVRYAKEFKKSGADLLTVHYEACSDLSETIKTIRELGMKVGVALKPATPADVLAPFISELDLALIMSVEPGFGGQSFMPVAYEKLEYISSLAKKNKPELLIEVDGGVNLENVGACLEAGANVIVIGSAIFSGDIRANAEKYMNCLRTE